jgi:hypothetical protein
VPYVPGEGGLEKKVKKVKKNVGMGPHVTVEAVENWREKGAANEDRDARIVEQQQRVRDFL